MTDALQLLRDDHKKVKDLFSQFEAEDDTTARGEIARQALDELEIHAEIEEKIFYPAVRKEADADSELMNEADEEHHVVKLLIGELRRMKPSAERFAAKFTVLAENVKHHIDEEESEMLPVAAELGMARMNELGAEMERRKAKLAGTPSRPSPARRPASRRTTLGTAKPRARTAAKASVAKRATASSGAKRSKVATAAASTRRTSAAAATTRTRKRATTRAATPAKRTAKRAK